MIRRNSWLHIFVINDFSSGSLCTKAIFEALSVQRQSLSRARRYYQFMFWHGDDNRIPLMIIFNKFFPFWKPSCWCFFFVIFALRNWAARCSCCDRDFVSYLLCDRANFSIGGSEGKFWYDHVEAGQSDQELYLKNLWWCVSESFGTWRRASYLKANSLVITARRTLNFSFGKDGDNYLSVYYPCDPLHVIQSFCALKTFNTSNYPRSEANS